MFFERRRWAIRVVERVCVDMRSQEATLLVDMIIWEAKHAPAPVPKRKAAVVAAIGMATNQSAIAMMARELVVSPAVAEQFLDRVRRAAVAVAKET
jgi:hypothetical protein